MKRIIVLGSTGSVGRQTLDIVRQHPQVLHLVGLSAGGNTELLESQIAEFEPEVFAVADETAGRGFLERHPHLREHSANSYHDFPMLSRTLSAIPEWRYPSLSLLWSGKGRVEHTRLSWSGHNVSPLSRSRSCLALTTTIGEGQSMC